MVRSKMNTACGPKLLELKMGILSVKTIINWLWMIINPDLIDVSGCLSYDDQWQQFNPEYIYSASLYTLQPTYGLCYGMFWIVGCGRLSIWQQNADNPAQFCIFCYIQWQSHTFDNVSKHNTSQRVMQWRSEASTLQLKDFPVQQQA